MNNRSAAAGHIIVVGAGAHNLRHVNVKVPHNQLVVITGVSGSGKSSLAFDTICMEGQRRYLESFSTRARQLLGKLGQPDVESITNLSPAIAIDQKTSVRNPRSTVGTMSELYDHLRLLFARLGSRSASSEHNSQKLPPLQRSLFSFNSIGACPNCQGLGVEDKIDQHLLVLDPTKTLREGALVITTGSGYIIYSQVTMDVLNEVCNAHDFNVDIPWCDLTDAQKEIVLYGSDRIKIPFGKHTLESRMKWSGIKARPRTVGYYTGIIPVMEQILQRDRNKNILRFVSTNVCSSCDGSRLSAEALAVLFQGKNIAEFAALSIGQLHSYFSNLTIAEYTPALTEVAETIRHEILKRTSVLFELGLSYLTLDRAAPTLSGGEAQRIRLASIVGAGLRGVTYVLDEPSVGLHARDNARLLSVLRQLVDQGNSVLVVEHSQQTMLAADWLIDIGPAAGVDGGEILFSGPAHQILAETTNPQLLSSRTRAFLRGDEQIPQPQKRRSGTGVFKVLAAKLHNLRNIDVKFKLGAFNIVTGVSGAGKSSLLQELIKQAGAAGQSQVKKIIIIDQAAIGRTPRSNPATYTGLFDSVRALFAALPRAAELGLTKGSFSFNNKGGRCEHCMGAGAERFGMHFLGDVEVVCPVCQGKRFNDDILGVCYNGKNISQILEMSIAACAVFFADLPKLARHLDTMVGLGLGYIALGQRSTTLSGGEAQRIKLAAELSRPSTEGTLYILDEPTTGLHTHDVKVLLAALGRLADSGSTVVVTEHNLDFIKVADWVVDLGPESGDSGGQLVYQGSPAGIISAENSLTGRAIKMAGQQVPAAAVTSPKNSYTDQSPIQLRGVQTHNLQNLDVDIPTGQITVITGVSGSGKSSLAMDTLFAEGRSRYAENFSTYIRQQLTGSKRADLASCHGLTPTIAISQQTSTNNPRSTVATVAEIHPLLRLLMSRFGDGKTPDKQYLASNFSFNSHDGACGNCRGLGLVVVCDPNKIVTHPDLSILAGALDGNKFGRFYGEPDGQFVATLKQVGTELELDFSVPWQDLGQHERDIAFNGTSDREYCVTWSFKRGSNEGEHSFTTTWPGFSAHVADEYHRKHDDKRGAAMLAIMKEESCPVCSGQRLNKFALAVTFTVLNIAQLCANSISENIRLFEQLLQVKDSPTVQICTEVLQRLKTLRDVGLDYLSLDRRSSSLSGGEAQRLRLARQLGVQLRGVTYIIDEPTRGLHVRDTKRLWRQLTRLRDQGNTLVLVEHDAEVILAADYIIDLGPGPGRLGGQIVAQGTPEQIIDNEHSVTGRYLKQMSQTTVQPESVHQQIVAADNLQIKVQEAHCNNLANIDVNIMTGCITVITGVSGSGKSSLLFGVIAESAKWNRPVECDQIAGLDQFTKVVPIVQNQSSATANSSVATASGIFDLIRKLLAGSNLAKSTGQKVGFFSPNQRGGRCEDCQGTGTQRVSMDFLADVTAVCPTCQGQRFKLEILACCWNQSNVSDILMMTVTEATEFFDSEKKITTRLRLLADVGLGYLTLGQAVTTLSGGEQQRLNLATELLSGNKGYNLYLCDEPSAGLHFDDIKNLCGLFEKLTKAGHTVIFTEHNQQLINFADFKIELGPGAGKSGGQLVLTSPDIA